MSAPAEVLDYLTDEEAAELDALLMPPIRPWLEQVSPAFRWDWPHLVIVEDALDAVTYGDITKLMVFEPPRHGKTELTTIRYPVFRLVQDPTLSVIVAAYNHALASKFSRKSRALARQVGLALNDERQAAEDWETTAGGGIRAVGVGTGVTGTGGGLIIIDDPVKSREEAESPTYRDRCWEWWQDDLRTRREPGAATILQVTRWHEDDLAGRILNSEEGKDWTVISLPALAEDNDPLGRAVGAALCPDRYDVAALAEIQRGMTDYSWSALYQQRPRRRSGNMFPRDMVLTVDAAPAGITWVRFWDKAGTDKGGDWTAGVKLGIARDGVIYVADVRHEQRAASARRLMMRATAEQDGGDCAIGIEQEGGSAGKDAAADDARLLAGFRVTSEHPTGDKVTRAEPFAAQWQAGNVRLVKGAWNPVYLDEMEGFPHAAHDDQVDASSGAYKLALGGDTGLLDYYRDEAAVRAAAAAQQKVA